MAWTDPVIDKDENAFCLPEDLNRIDGNINYLIGTSLKTDFASDDFLTLAQWNSIITNTVLACNKYGVKYTQEPNTEMTSANFNNVENLLLQCFNVLELWKKQKASNVFAQNQVGRYVAVPADNYVRGFNY